MSIISAFDGESEALMSPSDFYEKSAISCKIMIVTFSFQVLEYVINCFQNKEIGNVKTANGNIPIFLVTVNHQDYGFYMSPIGASICGTIMQEAGYIFSVQSFIVFGSCGSLNKELTNGRIIVPTKAYRDEGFSYHFTPPCDFIKIKNASIVNDFFRQNQISCVTGPIWTTDAFYRETRNKVRLRQEEGCIAVEMELSGIQAMADYCCYELYHFIFAGDLLDASIYEKGDLGGEKEKKHQLNALELAFSLAHYLLVHQ